MNKKFKLFTTIASLCLAVCLMAFGVWAASSVSYSITASLKYEVGNNISAKISGVGFASADATVKTGTGTGATLAEIELKGDAHEGLQTGAFSFTGDITLDSSKPYAVYVITVHQVGSNAITASVSGAGSTNFEVYTTGTTASATTTSTTDAVVTVAFKVISASAGANIDDAESVTITLNLTKASAQ